MPRAGLAGVLGLAAALVAAAATAQADTLLLQQNLPGDVGGTPFLLVDRSRISHVTVTKETSLVHRLTIRLATEPPVEIGLTCNDEAITRQVLDALRRGGVATLDITGRCRL
jgi:hypothetical protein